MTKEEKAAYDKAYREKNRAQIAKHRKEYYEEHKEEKAAYDKIYREKNAERRKEAKRQWYKKNKDKMKKYNKEYYTTIEGLAARRKNHYVWEDKNMGGDTAETVTKQWIIDNILTNNKCFYCGDDEPSHLGCDRIDNNKYHTPDNVICACGICNSERKILQMSVEEFVEYRKIYPREKEKIGDGKSYQTKDGKRMPLKKKEIPGIFFPSLA